MKSRFVLYFAWSALVFYGGAFLYLVVRHILYPGFTEPQEADILQHIERLIQGLPLYPKPGGEFIALAHMPLYYFVSAPFFLVFGDSFIGPRLVSSLCAVTAGCLVGWIAWRESRSRGIAYLAGALYFSGYRIMDAYATSAMPDSLMLVLLLLGWCFFAYASNRWHDIMWLICLTLAFWTKQHGAFYFGFAVLYALCFRRNFLPRWAIVLGMLLGGPVAYMLGGRLLGDGFFFHTYTVSGHWERQLWYSVYRSSFVLAYFVPFSCLLTLIYLQHSTRLRELRLAPLGWFTITAFLSAMFTMMASGSSNNHYIPFIAILAATAALGVHALIVSDKPPRLLYWLVIIVLLSVAFTPMAMRPWENLAITVFPPIVCLTVLGVYSLMRARRLPNNVRQVAVATLLVAGQFAVASYYLPHYLPEPAYKEDIARLRRELAKLDGPVIWAPYGNVPAALSGTKIARAPSWVALDDIDRQLNVREKIEQDLSHFREHIRSTKNLYVLSDRPIETIPVWRSLAEELILVKDFGEEFAAVRQVVTHWYGSTNYPRFLYRQRLARRKEYSHARPVQ